MSQPGEREEAPERTHGFAPTDGLSDVCCAYTSHGYCWRPKKHPIHGTGVGMSLYECNKPEQRFNAEREKKVAEHAATRMRERCVEKVRALASAHRLFAQTTEGVTQELQKVRAEECDDIITALESLTLEAAANSVKDSEGKE